MTNTTNPTNGMADALDALQDADQSTNTGRIMPVSLVWDYDLTRGGKFGGFFLATDNGEGDRYRVLNAPDHPEFQTRKTSWSHDFPGIHLGDRTRFAVLATHKLFTVEENDEFKPGQTKKVLRFEAIALAKDVIDLETNRPALVKLTIRGTAAAKLYDYLVRFFPYKRLTSAIHTIAERAFKTGSISRERLSFLKKQRATRQLIWIPIDTVYGQHLGRNKMQIGSSPYTDHENADRRDNRGHEFISRWDEMPDDAFATSEKTGGLLLDKETREFCKEHRVYWEEQLATYVTEKYGAEASTDPSSRRNLETQNFGNSNESRAEV
jgi:hypothetical protein